MNMMKIYLEIGLFAPLLISLVQYAFSYPFQARSSLVLLLEFSNYIIITGLACIRN